MRALSASELLEIRERGAGRSPAEQAGIILETALPGLPLGEPAGWTIGRRDASLIDLRERTFGSLFQALGSCPSCGERLEFDFTAAQLTAGGGRTLPENMNPDASFTIDRYEITFRLPTGDDLRVLRGGEDALPGRQRLLERCVLDVREAGKETPLGDLPAAALEALAEKMSQADPLADITIAAVCPACRHAWRAIFDIGSYFWSEIEIWAARLLREVHLLASAYGWRETDILAMSPWRRRRYLELIGT